ncbi:gp436 family protein [Morganella morganii]|uniref:gp436 family protein n=1 Tax=Morganella morganii TaxID=582 RepID=UPI0032DA7870
MSYATLADMYARYSRDALHILTDVKIDDWQSLSPEELQSTREHLIQIALDDSTATIDGYIDGRATLPLETVPVVLVRIACVLTRSSLEEGAATEKATKDQEDVIRLLEKVSAGDVSLGLSKESERPTGGDVAIITSQGSVWSREKSKGFI